MKSMTMKKMFSKLAVVGAAMLIALAGVGTVATVVLDASPAHAVIGRPMTAGSYAGVARRTSRRTTRRTVARTTAYHTALPAPGCPLVNGVYTCGATTYRPYYQGTNVVYVEVH